MTNPAAIHFTGNGEADELLAREPLALLIGFALDQQVPVPTAFAGPLKLNSGWGRSRPAEIAVTDPGRVDEVFRERPAIHRFPARWPDGCRACAQVVDEYGGDAAGVWTQAVDGDDLRRRIGALPGFGPMKITGLATALAKRFGVAVAQELVPPHPRSVTSTRRRHSPTTRPRSGPTRRPAASTSRALRADTVRP